MDFKTIKALEGSEKLVSLLPKQKVWVELAQEVAGQLGAMPTQRALLQAAKSWKGLASAPSSLDFHQAFPGTASPIAQIAAILELPPPPSCLGV